jgi:hypothetical protein
MYRLAGWRLAKSITHVYESINDVVKLD